MFAVIPHPTEALILSRTQKATLSRLNAEAGKSLWIPLFPLWAFFNNFDCRTQQLKTIRDAIASFTIDRPEVSSGEFFFSAILRFRNGETVRGKILAGKKKRMRMPIRPVPAKMKKNYSPAFLVPAACSELRMRRSANAKPQTAKMQPIKSPANAQKTHLRIPTIRTMRNFVRGAYTHRFG